ncbi:MAG: polyhydroxybutyrate depolymerase [Myxococcota bacterium]|jgi:polyhydroxybutyrate depolymerase
MYRWLVIALVALGCGGQAPRPGKIVKKVKREVSGAVKDAVKDAGKEVADAVKGVTDNDGDGTFVGNKTKKMTFDTPKGERFAYVHVPKGYDPSKPAPVIFVFHGGKGSSTAAQNFVILWKSQLDKQAIVVFPNGQDRDPSDTAWIARDFSDRSDVDLVLQIVDTLKAEYNVDSERIYASGFSNGGLMTTMLACHAPERFAGFAIFSQTMHKHIASECQSAKRKPVLYLAGTKEDHWPGRDFSHSAMESVEFWRKNLGCAREPAKTDLPDQADGTSVQRWTFEPCKKATFEFLRVEGGEHIWPGPDLPERGANRCTDIDGATEVVQFFERNAGL